MTPASWIVCATTSPACLQADSNTPALTASAPVWELAAFMPAWLRPPLRTTTGLRRAASRESSKNRRPSSTPSM